MATQNIADDLTAAPLYICRHKQIHHIGQVSLCLGCKGRLQGLLTFIFSKEIDQVIEQWSLKVGQSKCGKYCQKVMKNQTRLNIKWFVTVKLRICGTQKLLQSRQKYPLTSEKGENKEEALLLAAFYSWKKPPRHHN